MGPRNKTWVDTCCIIEYCTCFFNLKISLHLILNVYTLSEICFHLHVTLSCTNPVYKNFSKYTTTLTLSFNVYFSLLNATL